MSSQASQNYYNFFDDMNKNCVYKAVINVNNGTSLVLPTAFKTIMDCESSSLNASEKKVCNMFNNLINTICSINSSSETNRNLNDDDYIYLELWIILALKREGAIGNVFLGDISNSINNEIEGCFSKDLLKYILDDIDRDHLKKMELLDNLYKNYFEIYDIFNSTGNKQIQNCSQYSSECIKDYKNARQLCSDRSDYFYKALMTFKKTYKKFYYDAIWKDTTNAEYVLKLPADYEIEDLSFYSMEDETFTLILISLFSSVFAVFVILIYIYMFTPIGTRMRARRTNKKKKFRNQDDNNKKSLQFLADSYNLGSNSRMYNLTYHST